MPNFTISRLTRSGLSVDFDHKGRLWGAVIPNGIGDHFSGLIQLLTSGISAADGDIGDRNHSEGGDTSNAFPVTRTRFHIDLNIWPKKSFWLYNYWGSKDFDRRRRSRNATTVSTADLCRWRRVPELPFARPCSGGPAAALDFPQVFKVY